MKSYIILDSDICLAGPQQNDRLFFPTITHAPLSPRQHHHSHQVAMETAERHASRVRDGGEGATRDTERKRGIHERLGCYHIPPLPSAPPPCFKADPPSPPPPPRLSPSPSFSSPSLPLVQTGVAWRGWRRSPMEALVTIILILINKKVSLPAPPSLNHRLVQLQTNVAPNDFVVVTVIWAWAFFSLFFFLCFFLFID